MPKTKYINHSQTCLYQAFLSSLILYLIHHTYAWLETFSEYRREPLGVKRDRLGPGVFVPLGRFREDSHSPERNALSASWRVITRINPNEPLLLRPVLFPFNYNYRGRETIRTLKQDRREIY